jgi:hypothetical protein
VNILLLLAALLLAGGIWYAIGHAGNPANLNSAIGTIPERTNGNRSISSQPNGSSPTISAHATTAAPNQASASLLPSSSKQNIAAGSSHRIVRNHSSNTISAERMNRLPSSSRAHHHTALSSNNPTSSSNNAAPNSTVAQSIAHSGEHRAKFNAPNAATLNPQQRQTAIPQPPEELPPLPIGVVTVPDHTTNYTSHRDILNPYPIEEHSSSYIPLRVFAGPQYRSISFAPLASNSAAVRQNKGLTSGSTNGTGIEAGVEYEFSPWIAFGIRGGQINSAQDRAWSYPGQTTGSNSVSNLQNHDSYIAPSLSTWAGLSGTWTFNPADPLRISASLASGPVLGTANGWIGMAGVALEHDLSHAFLLRAEISYDLSEIEPVQATGIVPNGSIEAFRTLSTPQQLVSRAIGFSIGISFHP